MSGAIKLVNHDLALISGMPGSGKSTFGRWLEQRHAVPTWTLRIAALPASRSGSAGNKSPTCHPLMSSHAFRHCAGSTARRSRLGLPPPWLPLVRALDKAGVTAWWFDGDRTAARDIFIRRSTVSADTLDLQMAPIVQHWPRLEAFYKHGIVPVVDAGGTFMTPEEIYGRVFRA